MRLQDNGGGGDGDDSTNNNNNNNNPCVKWLRAQGHGKQDMTLTVHQTFVDPDCLHLPIVDNVEDLTPRHCEWAEHTILLYLERAGLTATVVYELATDHRSEKQKRTISMSSLSASISMGRFSLKNYRNNSNRNSNSNRDGDGVESDLFNIRPSGNNNNNNNDNTKQRSRHSIDHLTNNRSSAAPPISGGGHNARFPARASSMPSPLMSGQAAATAAAADRDQAKIASITSSSTSISKRRFSFVSLSRSSK